MKRIQRDKLGSALIGALLIIAPNLRVYAQNESHREQDGLIGPVHTVLWEAASVRCVSGKCVEGERGVISRVKYEPDGSAVGGRGRPDINDPRTRMRHYPFDESIPQIETPTYAEDGSLLYKDVYTYDNKGRQAEFVSYDTGGAVRYRQLIVFDKHGRLTEIKDYGGKGILEGWIKLHRDERGNLIEGEDGEGSFCRKTVSAYEFDDVGNWVKAKRSNSVYKDGRLTSESSAVEYRTLTYY